MELSPLIEQLGLHSQTLVALHVDFTNWEISDLVMTQFLKKLVTFTRLRSFGINLSTLNLNKANFFHLNTIIQCRSQILESISLGFHKSNIDEQDIARILGSLAKCKNMAFLRLNLSSSNSDQNCLEKVLTLVQNIDIRHLELYLGGSIFVTDAYLDRLFLSLQKKRIYGLRLDIGYTEASARCLEKFSMRCPSFNNLSLHLNG